MRLLQWAGMVAVIVGIVVMHPLALDHILSTSADRRPAAAGLEHGSSEIAIDPGRAGQAAAAPPTGSDGVFWEGCAGCEPGGFAVHCLSVGCLVVLVAVAAAGLARPRPRRWWRCPSVRQASVPISMILRSWLRPAPNLVELSISRT